MRILSITAGAASMYCGSCLRDNALAAELMRRGHEVTLVPLYTPTRTDEPNVSQSKVFFGGISVYLEQHVPLFRHTPALLDRLWDSRWALSVASRRAISVDAASLGDLTVSVLRGEHGHQAKEFRKLVEWLRQGPRPDVISLPHALLISLAEPLKEALDRPVCCTLQGENLFLDGLPDAYRRETIELMRASVPFVDAFAAVSDFYAGYMTTLLGVPPEAMHVVPLGISLEGFDTAPPPDVAGRFTVGFLARIAPEKGLHVLCEAYRWMREHGLPASRLLAAGYLAPEHRGYLEGIQERMKSWGLGDEFEYWGIVDRPTKLRFLQGVDVVSVPATYDEPKGLSLIEAMAAGRPIVQPRRGAFPELVARTGGGVLVDVADTAALGNAILSLFADADGRRELGRRAALGVRRHFTVAQEAEQMLRVLDGAASGNARRRATAVAG